MQWSRNSLRMRRLLTVLRLLAKAQRENLGVNINQQMACNNGWFGRFSWWGGGAIANFVPMDYQLEKFVEPSGLVEGK